MTTPIIPLLVELLSTRGEEIDAWLGEQAAQTPPHLYNSVDLRHSGSKLVPVDTNLYPAGFNNLSPAAKIRAIAAFKTYIAHHHPTARKLLIFPESHTRNLAYLDNLHVLQELLTAAGLDVRIGNPALEQPSQEIQSASGAWLTQWRLTRNGAQLETAEGYVPDLVVLNNDLTPGIPEILHRAAQPVTPPVWMGWFQRRKSTHFEAYEQIAKAFADAFSLDPWWISASFARCGMVNFRERTGLECVALHVEKVLHAVRRKYEEYGITQEPYVFIKADSGTYGMGIMTARSGDELFEMNKKTRNKMQVIKEGAENHEVIIQEGVMTVDLVKEQFAEPMIYLVGGTPVGGAYRINGARDSQNNLNATGMAFTGMCDEAEHASARVQVKSCNFRVYGLIARLAALAAARESYPKLETLPALAEA